MIHGMQATGGLASLFGVGQPRENQYQYVWCMIAMEEAFRLSWIINFMNTVEALP